jgi:hypothetical protein
MSKSPPGSLLSEPISSIKCFARHRAKRCTYADPDFAARRICIIRGMQYYQYNFVNYVSEEKSKSSAAHAKAVLYFDPSLSVAKR